ncbi:hypothetical protein K7432_007927 [Basidiobolus ranarum]|uniref:SHSP domain-containing protein n=1 Tax=Basidiobolus ranarum TaxID=34480 RepID=A0ABR2VZD2_9FUNG
MSLSRVFSNVIPELRHTLAMMEEPLALAARHNRGVFTPFSEQFKSVYAPVIDLSESNTGYTLEAELPGISKDNIEITFANDNTLVLKSNFESVSEVNGEGKPLEKNEGEQSVVASDDKKYWRKERVKANFERHIQFPSRVDADKVKAKYKDGVLTIDIPKHEGEKIKRISIDSDNN